MTADMLDLDSLDFAKGDGTLTVVTQDAESGAVLMVAHADREALQRTLDTGEMHYRSRTRGLWHKGATSGNTQRVVALLPDCDRDALLALVVSTGPACHTGARSCFGDRSSEPLALSRLDDTIAQRAGELATNEGDAQSYTRRLLSDRNLRLKKIGEESAELVTACADGDTARATEETADLCFHALVALRAVGGSLAGVRAVLAARVSAPRR